MEMMRITILKRGIDNTLCPEFVWTMTYIKNL